MGLSRKHKHIVRAPSASRQVQFHQLLVAARKTWLRDALSAALKTVDPVDLKQQIQQYAPRDVQQILAAAGIRDEYVFPTPVVLVRKPTLVGYYRLLLGVPRKGFYRTGTGMSLFQNMEKKDTVTPQQTAALPAFCKAMSVELAELVRGISPRIATRDLEELPLLTLGSMIQGANNVKIGEEAKQNVFVVIREIVRLHIQSQTANTITVQNAAGRVVTLSFGADPDIRIQERFGDELRNRVAVEIKGGTDSSNAYNRVGEAEKSHQRARAQGFRDFWTLIATRRVDLAKLKSGSPTTRGWFDVTQILAREGPDWIEFRSRLIGEVGIPAA